jgi:tight adherence protein C
MFGIQFDDLIVFMATATALLTLLAVWAAFLPKDQTAARARALLDRREALRSAAMATRRRSTHSVQAMGLMRSVVVRMKLLSSKHAESCTLKLSRAGFRSNDAMIMFLFAKVFGPLASGLAAAFLFYVVEIFDWQAMLKIGAVVAATLAGTYLPDLYVSNAMQKRQKQLRKALPDGIDLMVICAEAGLSLDATMQRVSRELARTWPELADEYSLTSVEIGFMPDRRQALENLSARCFLPGVRAMVNTLSQTEKYGTPLADSLRVLAAELRTERMLKAEEKAARLPATLTVPMILFVLPPLFVVLIGPAVLSVGDAFVNN